MKLTFSLDVKNLVGERDDLFNSISAKVKYFTNLSDKNKLFWLLNCENQEILNCWKISLPKHALITTIYLFYILTLADMVLKRSSLFPLNF
jgi:hypothetical protein